MAEPQAPEPPKPELPEAEEAPPRARKPLGGEAWAAISAISVALITGAVTLITHFVPEAEPAKAAPTNPPAVAGPQSPPGSGLERLVGRWSGEAESGQGRFRVELVVGAGCAEGRACGTISVSHLPCYGELSLLRARGDGSYEFSVDNFRAGSSKSCTPGPGEYFRPTPDGKLTYRTGYDGSVSGVLSKLP